MFVLLDSEQAMEKTTIYSWFYDCRVSFSP